MATRTRLQSTRRIATLAHMAAVLCLAMPLVAPNTTAQHAAMEVDDLLVIDCLLPGKLMHLGTGTTFVGARRPVRATALDCGIRGGEYTAYDRSNYQTARDVWHTAANSGDPKAQNYLGEIYERGLGIEPDFATAAVWYERAAKQAFPPAQINLGKLYERGLGVARDNAKALRLYRQASGLQATDIPTAVTTPEPLEQDGPTIQMIDPQAHATRGIVIATAAAGSQEKTLIGRVIAPAGVRLVSVNDRELNVESSGIFQHKITLAAQGTTTANIVAIDAQGKRAERRVQLRAEKPMLPRNDFGNYYALVIGNNEHRYLQDLQTAKSDATAVAQLLGARYGFEVTTLYDATRYQILNALNQMREKLTEKDNLLIYYAGHGELDKVNDRGYWLPVDAERDSNTNWISNVALTDILNIMTARHVLVVADSCYSGTLTRSVLTQLKPGETDESRQRYYKTALGKQSRLSLTSGALAPVLDSGDSGHSVFANAFLDILSANDGVLEGHRLYMEVVARVTQAAYDRQFEQVPQFAPIKFAGHEAGDFFLVPSS